MAGRLLAALSSFAVVAVLAPTAAADDGLEDYLREASDAEFHGRGIVMCTWGVDSAAATYEVTRSQGMSMVHGPGGELMSSGGISAMRSGSDWYAVEVTQWATWQLSDRYTITEPVPTDRLGRAADQVLVLEGDLTRARLIVDRGSTVPLVTEIFDGDGNLFRLAAMLEFSVVTELPPPMPSVPGTVPMMAAQPPTDLPSEVAGYHRSDAYQAPNEAVQAFYTDGLFTFSVFTARRSGVPDDFKHATEFTVDDERYRRIVTPSHVWVHWRSRNRSYVMVGDLPPDHIAAVLRGMPAPGSRGFFSRLWRGLFG